VQFSVVSSQFPADFCLNPSTVGLLLSVSSKTFGGVQFVVNSNDHLPRHVHGLTGETQAKVELLGNGTVALSKQRGAVQPPNAKRSDVRKILNMAAQHFEELVALWESVHGR